MPLSLALVFHFNQHTNEYADIANRACYRGLLTALRGHPKLKCNLHFSGTLLRALPWFDSHTLELVRAGLADGQFELLGSTYAQNVPYASHDWDNAQQIALHRQVLSQMFGAAPTAFWISERCWRQSLLPLIAGGGYRVVPIEGPILRAAGLDDPRPAETAVGEQSLTLVWDDPALRDRFNYAAWFGRRAQLLKYLQQIAERPGSDQFFMAYAEDAEAMGLWGWERGYLPQASWANLDALLGDLEGSDQLRLRHLSEARAVEKLEALPDGAAGWMDRALVRSDAPYHVEGYSNWFDFNQRSPSNAFFRKLHQILRVRLQNVGARRNDPGFLRSAVSPADRFYRQAIEILCHHEYEFGCIGVGGRGYWGWENARAAFAFARAAEIADEAPVGQWVEDANGDGADEQFLCNGDELAVFSAHGARLLYWFDLHGGRQWVGNQLAVPAARFVSDASKVPQTTPAQARWLPDSFEPSLKGWQSSRVKEAAPTRLGRHLPQWVFERDTDDLTVYRSPIEPARPRQPLVAQVGALAESVRVDGAPEHRLDTLLDYRFEADGITYLLYPIPKVRLEKHVSQLSAGLAVRYRFENRDAAVHSVRLRSVHELTPDYAEALGQGQAAYSFFLHADRDPAVRNNLTGTALVLTAAPAPTQIDCALNLLALQVELQFDLRLEPQTHDFVEIELRRIGAAAAGQ